MRHYERRGEEVESNFPINMHISITTKNLKIDKKPKSTYQKVQQIGKRLLKQANKAINYVIKCCK